MRTHFYVYVVIIGILLIFKNSCDRRNDDPSLLSKSIPDSSLVSVVSMGDQKLLFREGALETLRHAYKDQDAEFPFCLHGTRSEDRILVKKLRVPDVDLSEGYFGVFNNAACVLDSGYLGMVHNHPTGVCFPSPLDFKRFRSSEFAILEVVACRNDLDGVSFFGASKPYAQ